MSAADLLQQATRMAGRVACSLLGWIFIAPLAALMPRRHDWMAVIGRADGQFLDNAKYFFLQAGPLLRPQVRVVFLTERAQVQAWLAGSEYEVMRYPSWRSVWFLLRCGVTVVDSSEWFARMRRFLLLGTRLVQLWHGVGFKRIGLDKWRHQVHASRWLGWPPVNALRRAMHRVSGRLVRYDVVNTTSAFYRDEVFMGALPSRHYLVCGYPRNTFGDLPEPTRTLAVANVDREIADRVTVWQAEGRRIVLVTPTFRDSRTTPMGLTPEVVAMLDAFCAREKVELVFKFHLLERAHTHVHGQHLHLFDAEADIYPLMPLASAMVTDYSSIYMDFLLLDKPVLFLVPDIQQYVREDRQMQFDFDAMTPGPKLTDWTTLTETLLAQWRHHEWADARAGLRRLAFDDLDQHQAAPKLIEFMQAQGWLRGGG